MQFKGLDSIILFEAFLLIICITSIRVFAIDNSKNYLKDIIKNDFKINNGDLNSPGITSQYGPIICMNNDGEFIIVWNDYRYGNGDIFAQKYNSDGKTIGNNIKINHLSLDIYGFDSCIDKYGNFVVVWADQYNDEWNIYFQILDRNGIAIGENQLVNDEINKGNSFDPSITIDKNGNFIVTWVKNDNDLTNIYFQQYNNTGNRINNNVLVNEYSIDFIWDVSITSDSYGRFTIAWIEGAKNPSYGPNYDIFFKKFDPSGQPISNSQKVNDDANNSRKLNSKIVSDSIGSITIVWEDFRNGEFDIHHTSWKYPDIYMQRYAPDGSKLGENIKVNIATDKSTQTYPNICANAVGDIIITWNSDSEVYYRKYNAAGEPYTNPIKVKGLGDGQISCDVNITNSKDYILTWCDNINSNYEIMYQSFNENDEPYAEIIRVNDDTRKPLQENPDISMKEVGNFVIVWEDFRNGNENDFFDADVYIQIGDQNGRLIGDNIQINEDNTKANQYNPCVDMNRFGDIIVVWTDFRNFQTGNNELIEIYSQKFNNNCQKIGNNFKISADISQQYPSVAINDSGQFVVIWYNQANIYYQYFDSDITTTGIYEQVNDISVSVLGRESPASVDIDQLGNFYIVWADYIDHNIYLQIFDSLRNRIGGNIKVNDDFSSEDIHFQPNIIVTENNKIMVTWRKFKTSSSINNDVLVQLFSTNGARIGKNIKVNSDDGYDYKNNPNIEVNDDGNFVISWEVKSKIDTQCSLFAQRFYSNGKKWGSNTRILGFSAKFNDAQSVLTLNNSRIIFSWTDNRDDQPDIFAKIIDWDWPELTTDKQVIPTEFLLYQNYPNPFNNNTKIQYYIQRPSNIELRIYDINGKYINSIVNEFKSIGLYESQWNGRDYNQHIIASGIYYYSLLINGTFFSSRKMLYLK